MKKHNKRQQRRRQSASPAPPGLVIQTVPFRRAFAELPAEVQRSVLHKITYLTADPRHPSLHVHRLRARLGTWICAVSRAYRLFYQRVGHKLILCDVGTYRTINRLHRR